MNDEHTDNTNRSNAEVQASPEFAALKSAYEQIDLEAWVPYIDQAAATANALNAMRTPATNPFTLTIKTLASVSHTVDSIRGGMLDSLSASVKQFNGLWHNNASVAFEVCMHMCGVLGGVTVALKSAGRSMWPHLRGGLDSGEQR